MMEGPEGRLRRARQAQAQSLGRPASPNSSAPRVTVWRGSTADFFSLTTHQLLRPLRQTQAMQRRGLWKRVGLLDFSKLYFDSGVLPSFSFACNPPGPCRPDASPMPGSHAHPSPAAPAQCPRRRGCFSQYAAGSTIRRCGHGGRAVGGRWEETRLEHAHGKQITAWEGEWAGVRRPGGELGVYIWARNDCMAGGSTRVSAGRAGVGRSVALM